MRNKTAPEGGPRPEFDVRGPGFRNMAERATVADTPKRAPDAILNPAERIPGAGVERSGE